MDDNLLARRQSFDKVAALYDEVRPCYPEPLIEEAVQLSGLSPEGRILEVGCGTGQATAAFARRGYEMLCLDIGPQMAALTREKVKDCPKVEVRVVSFEEWEEEEGGFDLVVGALSFHLIDPEVSYAKSARALKPTGALALLRNKQPKVESEFFDELQHLYEKYVPELVAAPTNKASDEKDEQVQKIDSTGLFEKVIVRQHSWSAEYDAMTYIKLLNTYSDHNCLPAEKKALFFAAVEELIERHGGRFVKPYEATLYLAKKKR